MAGVTANCKNCGITIYDEATRRRLCIDCLLKETIKNEVEKKIGSGLVDIKVIELSHRNRSIRLVKKKVVKNKSRRKKLEKQETPPPEGKSFLRDFKNIDLSGESEVA